MSIDNLIANAKGAIDMLAMDVRGKELIYSTIAFDHGNIRSLMAQVRSGNVDTRGRLYKEIRTELLAHGRAEDAHFYSRLLKHPEASSHARAAMAEHRIIEAQLVELDAIDITTPEWAEQFKLLNETVERHITSEESVLFPLAQEHIDSTVELDERFKIERRDHIRALDPDRDV